MYRLILHETCSFYRDFVAAVMALLVKHVNFYLTL